MKKVLAIGAAVIGLTALVNGCYKENKPSETYNLNAETSTITFSRHYNGNSINYQVHMWNDGNCSESLAIRMIPGSTTDGFSDIIHVNDGILNSMRYWNGGHPVDIFYMNGNNGFYDGACDDKVDGMFLSILGGISIEDSSSSGDPWNPRQLHLGSMILEDVRLYIADRLKKDNISIPEDLQKLLE